MMTHVSRGVILALTRKRKTRQSMDWIFGGDKVARQIILDLKGKLASANVDSTPINDELVEVLVGLGYKRHDIKKIIHKVDSKKSLEEQIKDALKLLLK